VPAHARPHTHTDPTACVHPSAPPPCRQTRESTFVALHYTDAAGRPAKLRASAEHLVYVAAPEQQLPLAGGAGAGELPPGGSAKRADQVAVGDLLVVQAPAPAAGAGGRAPLFYSARVDKIKL
jgi:hypothetical protein